MPTVAESGLPDYDVSAWYGLLAPAGTPRQLVDKINSQVRRAIQSKEVQHQLAQQGAEPVGGTPEEFKTFLAMEISKWAAAVKTAGAKVD